LSIVYEPQALFRVRAVTRCSDTLSGHQNAILSVHFSPNGRYLASGSGDSTCRIWDAVTATPAATLKGHSNWVLCVSWSPDGAFVASGGMDGSICIWDGGARSKINGADIPPLGILKGHKDAVTSLSWEPLHLNSQCRRLVSGSRDATVRVWDVKSRKMEFAMTQHTKSVTSVKWGGEGLIYTASRDCSIKVWSSVEVSFTRARFLVSNYIKYS
jgi:ribosome assembly protein 4